MTAKRKAGLGRGLQALIPTEPDPGDHATYLEVPVDGIKPNPDQPRSRFDDEALEELAASIKEVGVLQPVLVRPAADADVRYERIGEFRSGALKLDAPSPTVFVEGRPVYALRK